jgi:hypothetical protein
VVVAPATSAQQAASDPVVLGAATLFTDGVGWGTEHPVLIFNGGDPNGRAWKLKWSKWGGDVAYAEGLTWIFRPTGGYFTKPGAIELQAYGVGRCSKAGGRAYLHLRARESVRPGGPFGRWFAWAGLRTICRNHSGG